MSAPALTILPAGTWDLFTAIDAVALDFDQRYRRRYVFRTLSGRDMLLDLPAAVRLRHDDGLAFPEGIVRVIASPEDLLRISAAGTHVLMRAAWHLGNRHLPVQFAGATLLIRADHVIAGMLQGLGCTVEAVQAPFDPEPGAYAAAAHQHAHDD